MLEDIQFLSLYRMLFEYFDPLAVVWSAVKFAALGLFLALVAVIVCAKFKVFRRQNKFWNIAAKLYFLYIPIICIGSGAGFGLLQYIKSVNNKAVNALVQPVKQEMIGYLEGLSPEVTANLSFASLKTKIRDDIGQLFKDTAAENSISNFVNKLPNPGKGLVFNTLTNIVIDKVNAEISNVTGLDKKSLAQLWNKTAIELLKSDFLNDILSQRVNGFISGYQKALLLFLFLLLLVPAVDTLIARKLEKRSKLQLSAAS